MPRVEITVVGDDWRTFELDLTDAEFEGLKKVQEAYYNRDIGETSGKWIPTFQAVDMDAREALRVQYEKERAAAEQAAREAEAQRQKEEHERDIRENGPFAVAYRRALENKKRREEKKK